MNHCETWRPPTGLPSFEERVMTEDAMLARNRHPETDAVRAALARSRRNTAQRAHRQAARAKNGART
jgi:hypothetical protein